MKKLVFFLLLIIQLIAQLRAGAQDILHLRKDSMDISKAQWKYKGADDPRMALADYNDSGWISVRSVMYLDNPGMDTIFKELGWFRLRFSVGPELTHQPLAFSISHYGASEIYVDGKLIKQYGKIAGPEHTEYYNPKNLPFSFILDTPGVHVLAVRYANYAARKNMDVYTAEMGGFTIGLHESNEIYPARYYQLRNFSFVLISLFGIFLAFFIIHLLLYLYHRDSRSNLYFSLFCLSLALGFFWPYIVQLANYPAVELRFRASGSGIIALACLSLSGFTNEQFSRKKLRFRIIASLCIAGFVLRFINFEWSAMTLLAACIITSLESVILIGIAIYRKVEGARIIGTGLFMFALFFLVVLTLSIVVEDGLEFDDSKTSGQIMELVVFGAVLSIPLSMSAYLARSFSNMTRDLKSRLNEVKQLSEKALEQEQEKKRLLESRQHELEAEVTLRTAEVRQQKEEIEKQHEELKKSKKQSDDLLLNILPEEVADELKLRGSTEARYFDHVSVLFTDFVNFTQAGESMTPKELVDELHTCFKSFDEIISRYGIEKIKTIGDAYLAVSGLPVHDPDHASKMVAAAIEIRDFMEERKAMLGDRSFHIRIGIHSGPVVAGIVGVKKFAYDIWGDTVNTAARMEQSGEAGRINVSGTTYLLIRSGYECTYRGAVEAKNKGKLEMYFVERALVMN